jgi:hypothetical protein
MDGTREVRCSEFGTAIVENIKAGGERRGL